MLALRTSRHKHEPNAEGQLPAGVDECTRARCHEPRSDREEVELIALLFPLTSLLFKAPLARRPPERLRRDDKRETRARWLVSWPSDDVLARADPHRGPRCRAHMTARWLRLRSNARDRSNRRPTTTETTPTAIPANATATLSTTCSWLQSVIAAGQVDDVPGGGVGQADTWVTQVIGSQRRATAMPVIARPPPRTRKQMVQNTMPGVAEAGRRC